MAIKKVTIDPVIVIEKGGSVAELAKALGVGRGAATNLRKGGCDRLQLKTLVALSRHLGVSIESLLVIEDDEN